MYKLAADLILALTVVVTYFLSLLPWTFSSSSGDVPVYVRVLNIQIVLVFQF